MPREDVEGIVLLAGLLPANVATDINKDENASEYFKINTIGTINVLEYCRKNDIKRVISTSSYADVRNAWSADKALTEEEPRNFQYTGDHATYVISKNAANDILEYYNQQHGMKNAIFRFPPVYGVGPHGSLYVNGSFVKSGLQIFMERAREGKTIEIYGNPKLSRDVVYVKDVAKAFVNAMYSKNTYGLYNITSGQAVTLRQQAEVIADIFSVSTERKSEIIERPEIANNTPSYLFDISKAKKDFGYDPQYADFKTMMLDYKADLDVHKYQELFHY